MFFCKVSKVTVVVSFAVFTVLESLVIVVLTVPLLQATNRDRSKKGRYFLNNINTKLNDSASGEHKKNPAHSGTNMIIIYLLIQHLNSAGNKLNFFF